MMGNILKVGHRFTDLAAVDARLRELECVDLSGVQDMILAHLSRRAA